MNTTDHQTTEILKALEPALASADLRTLVLFELHALRDDLRLVRPLIDTRQAGLGFLSVEAAKVQDDLIRKEREDRVEHAKDGIKPSGVVPAPGSINAFSLLAEWEALLADVERRVTRVLLQLRVCHVSVRPDASTLEPARYARVVELVHVLSRDDYLRRLHGDLVDLHARVTRCVDGNQVKALPYPCPWCGLRSLVANLTTGVITCDRDPGTGEHVACLCSDSYCQCKTTPIRFRHTWHRDHKPHKSTSWDGLASAVAYRRNNPITNDTEDQT